MNKFLSRVAATTLVSAVAITSVSAFNDSITPNAPVWSGGSEANASIPARGGELIGADVNLTVKLNANAGSDTHFTLNFVNGSVANDGEYALCNNGVQAGTYIAQESVNSAGRMTAVVMEFKPKDGNTSLIAKGETLNFVSGSDCTSNATVNILPDAGKCVTVFSNHGQNTSGTVDIPDINSKVSGKVLEYKTEIKVSCSVPTCGISSDSLSFISQGTVASVNKREASSQTFDRNTSLDYSCAVDGCGETDSSSDCTTIISLQNNMVDRNLTKFILTPTFDGTLPANMTFVYDTNGTTEGEVKMSSGVPLSIDLTNDPIAPDANKTITLKFSTDGKTVIPEGLLTGTITNIEDNITSDDSLKAAIVTPKDGLAKFVKGLGTKFTVTYMNPNYKSFVMISALENETELSAVITDQNGKTASVTFAPIAKGKTAFVFADNKGTHGEYDLVKKVKDAGVDLSVGWRVDFRVTAPVDVAAYMEVGNGQRTLTVLYPEYAHQL